MMRSRIFLGMGFAIATIAGCGGGDGNTSAGTGNESSNYEYCSVDYKKSYINNTMKDRYYWYQEMPDVDPDSYSTMQALLDDLTEPEQTRGKYYSYLTTQAEENALLNNAGYIGFGFSSLLTADGRLFLRETFPGSSGVPGLDDIDPSPAYAAGLRRGDEITAIDGVAVSSMSAEEINAAFGPAEAGYTVEFDVIHADGTPEAGIEVSKAEVTIPTVSYAQAFDRDGNGSKETGYVFFRSFLSPSPKELDAVFGSTEWQDVTKLVLDLRYNGGGLVSVADHLGGLIAGAEHAGEVLGVQEFNDKHSNQNVTITVSEKDDSLPITDVVVVTTGGTASASELIINGLGPILGDAQVHTVGETSYGKPVGQSGFYFCVDVLRAVTFRTINADGEGDYYTGIPADCAADDDITHEFGNPAEASIAEALHVLENGGACSSASPKAYSKLMKRNAVYGGNPNPLYRDGWDVLTGGIR